MEREGEQQWIKRKRLPAGMQAHEEEFLQDLADFVAIPSVSVKQEGEGAEEAPYGQGCADCLNFFLKLGEKYGFETENLWGSLAGFAGRERRERRESVFLPMEMWCRWMITGKEIPFYSGVRETGLWEEEWTTIKVRR